MDDVDIQKLYSELQNNVSKLAIKLQEYIRVHNIELNKPEKNDELIRIAKLYMVLRYFADTNISQIDGNITENNVDRYKIELMADNVGIQEVNLNAIQSADLQGYFPNREYEKIFTNQLVQLNTLEAKFKQELENLHKENFLLKEQVQKSAQRDPVPSALLQRANRPASPQANRQLVSPSPPAPAMLQPANQRQGQAQYKTVLCNIDYITHKVWNVKTGSVINNLPIQTIFINNKRFISQNNRQYISNGNIYQVIEEFYVFIDSDLTIKTLDNKPYDNNNIKFNNHFGKNPVYKVTKPDIYMQYVPLNDGNNNNIKLLGNFINLTKKQHDFISSRTSKQMFVVNKDALNNYA
jgi:hypothetical protein